MLKYKILIDDSNNKRRYSLYKTENNVVFEVKCFKSKYELKMYLDLVGYHISTYTTIHKINTNGYIHTKIDYYNAK